MSQIHKHKFRHRHGENLISIDAYAYASRLIHINSGLKIGSSLFFLIFGLLADSITVSLLLLLAMACCAVIGGGISFRNYLNLMMIPLVFIALSSLAILFDVSFHPIGEYHFFLGFFYIGTAKTGIIGTIRLIFRALGAVSCLYMMILSTPTSEIIRVMRRCHIPQLVCELMNMIYRFIFILLDVQYRMTVAAKSRLGYCDLKTSFYSFGNVISNLLVLSLRRSNAYYDALESRCYDGELCFLTEDKPIRAIHAGIPLLLALALTAVWIVVKLTHFY